VEYLLEDDSARIGLSFSEHGLEPGRLFVTGVSVALLGKENEKGDFEVADYCFAGLDDVSADTSMNKRDPSLVALVSGVELGPATALPFHLLSEFLAGNLPCFPSLPPLISRVVLAGNSVSWPSRLDDANSSSGVTTGRKKYGVEHAKYDFSGMQALDGRLAGLSESLPVDLMPGAAEPTNQTLPQSALHRGLLQLSAKQQMFQPVTNPYTFDSNGRRFLGTSGQNLDDILRFSTFQDRLDVAEAMLNWRNIAPTAPDTLWCFPFFDRDPFVLQEIPDVLFIGNQPEFQSRVVEVQGGRRILIVLLPKLSQTGSFVLVNTADLTCECITLGTPK